MPLISDQPTLLTHGYEIIKSDSVSQLDSIRGFIANAIKKRCKNYNSYDLTSASSILNKTHLIAGIESDADANELVLDIIKKSSSEFDFSSVVYNSFKSKIDNYIGPDLHAQRNNNVVFQFPNSMRFSELHTDSPPNSPYELVFWVPLVDCYETKSFYIVPLNKSKMLLKDYREDPDITWDHFKAKCLEHAKHVKVDYGSAMIFWTGLIHGSLVNKTNESRWCINARFKNLFAPCGEHNPITYYRVFKTSSLSQLALDFQ